MSNSELSEFYAQFLPFGQVIESIPIKGPRFSTKPMAAHSSNRSPTPRSVAALAAAAAASRCKLVAGELVPRRLEDPAAVVENGASSDIIRAGLAIADVLPGGGEAFRLAPLGVTSIRAMVPGKVIDRYFEHG